MQKTRKVYTAAFKAKVAVTSLNQLKTSRQIASTFELNQWLVCKWWTKLKKEAEEIFKDWRESKKSEILANKEKDLDEAYKQIWKLKVENDWLKKKYDLINN